MRCFLVESSLLSQTNALRLELRRLASNIPGKDAFRFPEAVRTLDDRSPVSKQRNLKLVHRDLHQIVISLDKSHRHQLRFQRAEIEIHGLGRDQLNGIPSAQMREPVRSRAVQVLKSAKGEDALA